MSITENAVRETVANLTKSLEQMLVTAESYDSDFARGQASGITRSLQMVRNLFFDYRPCACGNPSVGPDITGAQMCARCANEAAHQTPPPTTPQGEPVSRAVGGGSIPTQPTGADR